MAPTTSSLDDNRKRKSKREWETLPALPLPLQPPCYLATLLTLALTLPSSPPPPSCLTASLSLSAYSAAQLLLTHFFSLPLSLLLSLSQLEHFNYALMAHNSQFPIRQLLLNTPPPFRSTPLLNWLQFPSLRCLRVRTSLAKATSFYSSPPPLSLSLLPLFSSPLYPFGTCLSQPTTLAISTNSYLFVHLSRALSSGKFALCRSWANSVAPFTCYNCRVY